MTYKELLENTPFEEIEPYLTQVYGVGNMLWYRLHYDMLRSLKPKVDSNAKPLCNIRKSPSDADESCEDYYDLCAWPMEDYSWEHNLTQEIKIASNVKASWPEIAACCLFHSSYYGFIPYDVDEVKDYFRSIDLPHGENIRCKRQIERIGGYIPPLWQLNPSKKKELIQQTKEELWHLRSKMNRSKRKKTFRQTFMSFYHQHIKDISRFILDAEPVWKGPSNSLSVKQLCGLYGSLAFRTEVLPSYVRDDMGISAAKYLENLIRKYPFFERKNFNRVIIHMVTGEQHERLNDDEQALINYIIEGGEGEQPFESDDLLISTDPSLGKQITLRLAFYKSDKTL